MTGQMQLVPEDWNRAMAIVAHPDDLEYGAASAVARWTRDGRSVAYVIVTDGEAGIDGLDPAQAGPLRRTEQVASAAVVGVDDVAFLGHRDGVVENGPGLRRDIARQIRRFRPDVLVTATYELTYGLAAGQRIVNQADHRAVGVDSLRAHGAYLDGLGRDFDPDGFVRAMTAMAGPAIGVPHAVAFGQIQLQGV
ncbi:MAG: PIG-L deacetylase family protein [Pseudonocardia sp.]